VGSVDGVGPLHPTGSVLQTGTGTVTDPSNALGQDPLVRAPFPASVLIETSRTFPAFRQAVIVVQPAPLSQMGDYHLSGDTSPASNRGAGSRTFDGVVVNAPRVDIDGQNRSLASPEAGADELPGATGIRTGDRASTDGDEHRDHHADGSTSHGAGGSHGPDASHGADGSHGGHDTHATEAEHRPDPATGPQRGDRRQFRHITAHV